MLNLDKLQFLYPLLFGFTFVWIVTTLGCDTEPVVRENGSSDKTTSTAEYFFGIEVQSGTDALGRQLPFHGVDKNGFPLVPDGFRWDPIWKAWEQDPNPEKWAPWSEEGINASVLINKVCIKLWNQGDHGFTSAIIRNERVYPLYPDTIYVQWKEDAGRRYIGRVLGTGDVVLTPEQKGKGEIPSGIQVLDYDSGGYDAYDFLTEVELNAGCGSEVGGVLIKCADSGN